MRTRLVLSLLAVLVGAGCGKSTHLTDGGVGIDANVVDSGGDIDAMPDAKQPLPAYEVTGGAAHVSGAHFAADVQIGHAIDQKPTVGTSHAVEGNAAVKP